MTAIAHDHHEPRPGRAPHAFIGISAEAQRAFERVSTTLRLKEREVLFLEGHPADRVFLVHKGLIKLTSSSPEGRLLLLRIAEPGEFIGVASLLGSASYRISAETMTPVEVAVIAHTDYLELMDAHAYISRATAIAVARKYDAVLLSARHLALFSTAAGKLASTLLDWARIEAGDHANAVEFTMPLTHEELGCMTGLSRETITRVLNRFRSEGLVEQQGDRMTLHQPEKLAALCS